jgi:predicted permease
VRERFNHDQNECVVDVIWRDLFNPTVEFVVFAVDVEGDKFTC